MDLSRGTLLIKMSTKTLQDNIEYLKRRKGVMNKRECKLREIIINDEAMLAFSDEDKTELSKSSNDLPDLSVKRRLSYE